MRIANRFILSRFALLLLMAAVAGSGSVRAADGNPAYTDPAAAGIDYKIQGEYQGTVAADGSRWGAQVMAMGDGKFRCVGYFGGLPGDGWKRGDETNTADGKLQGEVAVFDLPEYVMRIDGKKLRVETVSGEALGELDKVERKSPTLGEKAPEGAIVLFDGSNGDQWNNAKITDDHYLAATGVETKEKFGDHQLHIEFRTPFMPKSFGQARGNSGVYVQSRYEVQVLDSFSLEGMDNECGGIYSISKPKLNMCFPPLAWQTYDIDFRAARFDDSGKKTANARVTIKHNGVVIHDNLDLPHSTPGRVNEETAAPLPLFLQDHGNPVVFRNIWVVKK
ncbi:MAG: DUF1080 domain-containing protein [Planctomycetales bacterium]|nr:DUF1080 domain-containing protein [Planctomycetales bacterium]